jgi:ABC-type transport system involved in multi-copper enzyme maturation permease subunit
MNPVERPPGRLQIVSAIAAREARSNLGSTSLYLALTAALFGAVWVLLVDIRALRAGGFLVLANPLGPPAMVTVLLLAVYFAVSAAVSVASDRESGVLEVLFYAPVDEISYAAGKLAGLLIAYGLSLLIVLASFACLAFITGFALTGAVLVTLLVSIIPAAAVIAFGILLAIGNNHVRTAVVLLVGVMAVLTGVSLLYGVVLLLPIEDPSSPILPIRDALATLDATLRWLSPFAWLETGVDATLAGAWRTALVSLLVAMAGSALMLAAAALWLRRRGVIGGEG